MWEIEVRHDGLHKYRLIRGNDKRAVEQKAEAQLAAWEEMWRRKLGKEHETLVKQSKIAEALARSKEALEAIEILDNILHSSLAVSHAVNWEALKDHSKYTMPKPRPPQPLSIGDRPDEADPRYQPKLGFLDKIISSRRQNKIDVARTQFEGDLARWVKHKEGRLKKNKELKRQYQTELNQWKIQKQAFLTRRKERNAAIDRRKQQYLDKEPGAIVDYCELVLSNSEYPDYFPQDFRLDYNPETSILVIDYSLPSPEDLPKLKEVKYVQTRNEFVEKFYPQSVLNKRYDSVIYQVVLRTIHELYDSDTAKAIDSVVFNGWVESADKATGQVVKACIVSVQASRQEFSSLNLAAVDPKACFQKLKGVGSSKLHGLAAVAPILSINREDKRFISSYEVTDSLHESTNLAAMDWEDFEHLIRELFEKEFSQFGGEVKVTQASRDGGVDAIAFDPDPIRGGKIVIQAKRYTNPVGVDAVRDLYGTVINEGATKGILVTTADYGPDAYKFAKGKPLTLLNGSNLLYLLEKHGRKATIDLKAAKQILSEKGGS